MYSVTVLEFLNMGGGEIMLILAVVLLMFGGKKLPELARGLGKGIRDFKDASEGVKREIHRNINAMDLDLELEEDRSSPSSVQPEKSASESLHEQMYPKTEEKEPINLTKASVPVEHEVAEMPSQTAAVAETPESEKHKI